MEVNVNMANSGGNEDQAQYWSEAGGRSWIDFQSQLDRQLAPFGNVVVEALSPQPGESILDVGCGCGATTLDLAAAVGSQGRVVGLDISTSMVAVAVKRLAAAGHRHASAIVGDAQTVSEDEAGGRFDAVFSRFGVMFFADPVAAFANIRARTNADGRMAFVCWQSPKLNGWMNSLGGVVESFFGAGPAPDPHAPGPFAFADPQRTAAVLASAGWSDVAVEPCVRSMLKNGTTDFDVALECSLRIGSAARALQGVDPVIVTQFREAARAVLSDEWTSDGVIVEGVCWLVSAQNISFDQPS